jgi:MerR family copper efflux transcriptional regulator
MRIGELSAETSVSIQTLRYYERRGLLPAPYRRAPGFRVYDADHERNSES